MLRLYCTVARPPLLSVSSVTPTSITVSWSVQDFSPPVIQYRVQLTRVTGSDDDDDNRCSADDDRPLVITTRASMPFSSLHEFSTYTITVHAEFFFEGSPLDIQTTMNIETPSTGM